MADTSKKNNQDNDQNKVEMPKEGDPLFTLHHAQAEAALAAKGEDVSAATNEYMTEEEQENVEKGMTPRDSQGFVRGQDDSDRIGSNAGGHK